MSESFQFHSFSWLILFHDPYDDRLFKKNMMFSNVNNILHLITIVLLVCILKMSASTDAPIQEPLGNVTSPAYNNSRFHQECLKYEPNRCSCNSLWNSNCLCDGTDPPPFESNDTMVSRRCDCGKMCQELWVPNRPLSGKMQNFCVIPQVRRYSLKVFIASKSQDSIDVLEQIKMVMESMGDAIDLTVTYVLSRSTSNGSSRFISMNGPSEVLGDIIGRCAMNLYPNPKHYLPFLTCMGQDRFSIPANTLNCSLLHNINLNALQSCTSKGESVLVGDYQTTSHYNLENSPRVLMDERSYSPSSSQTYESYEAAMCYVFETPIRAFPWFIFVLMAGAILFVVAVLLMIRQWSNTNFLEAFQRIFIPWDSPTEGDTLLYLRAYGYMFDANGEPSDVDEAAENPAAPSPEPSPSPSLSSPGNNPNTHSESSESPSAELVNQVSTPAESASSNDLYHYNSSDDDDLQ